MGKWSFSLACPANGYACQVSLRRKLMPGFKRRAEKYGMRYPDGTVGVAITGTTDQASFLRLLRELPEGTWKAGLPSRTQRPRVGWRHHPAARIP